jgi:hypothetical protein
MARPLSYLHRIPAAIQFLEQSQADYVTRRDVQKILRLKRATAIRLLNESDHAIPLGVSLVCKRQDLIHYLKELRDNPDGRGAIERHNKVGRALEQMAQLMTQKGPTVAVNEQAAVLMRTRLQSLPEGVELQPWELRIRFHGATEFLQKFGAVVYALQNDWEAVRKFLEGSQKFSG